MDGSLTTLGVIIATLNTPGVLIAAGLGVAVANSVSNACGGYVSEKSSKITKHLHIRKAMLLKHGKMPSLHMSRAEMESLKRGLWDSAGTFVGALIPLFCVLVIGGSIGLILGTVVPILLYIWLGVWMSLLSRENVIVSVLKTTLFAVGVVVLTYLIYYLGV